MKSKNLNVFHFTLIIICLSFVIGCTKASTNVTTTTSPQTSTTYISILDLAAYSPTTVIYLNNNPATSAIAPGFISGSYSHLLPGNLDVKFKITGSDSVLADIPASLYDSAMFYTLILYNTDTTHKGIQAIKVHDDFSQIMPGFAYYRFFDFCPELGPIDVYMNSKLVQGGRYSGDLGANPVYDAFTSTTSTAYSIEVKKAGTDTTLYSLPSTPFMGGNAYTVFISGSKQSGSFPIAINVLAAAY